MEEQLKKEMINLFLAENSYDLKYFPSLQNNKEFMIEAVKQNGCVLMFASDDLRDDKEFMIELSINHK